MIIYYNNRQISSALQFNISRWKRWSREFLPPDPLGGLQSGYARQYSMREAFQVALGGHLVGFMKFSVHQARTILMDLEPWMKKNGYYYWNPRQRQGAEDEKIKDNYGIFIRKGDMKIGGQEILAYAVAPISAITSELSDQVEPVNNLQAIEFINTSESIRNFFFETPYIHYLPVGQFRKWFLDRLHPTP